MTWDTPTAVAWHLGGEALLRIEEQYVWLRQRPGDPWVLLVDPELAADPVAIRMRGVAQAEGRPPTTQYEITAPPNAPRTSRTSLWHDDEFVVTWEEAGPRHERRSRRPQSVDELPPGADHPARSTDSHGLTSLVARLRRREAPPRAPRVVGHVELVRREVRVEEELVEVVTTFRHGGRAVESRRALPVRQPATPRADEDGVLTHEYRGPNFSLEILRVNASLLLRIDHHGRCQEYFVPAGKSVDHGTELAWHRISRRHGLPPGSVVVREPNGMRRRDARAMAEGVRAERTEQYITPRAAFSPNPSHARLVTRRDLRLLERDGVPTSSASLDGDLSRPLLAAYQHLLGKPPSRWGVDVRWNVEERWVGHSIADRTYLLTSEEPVLPPLDDTGAPGSRVSVDSFGHLHVPDETWACGACDRWYCSACGETGRFLACGACSHLTCPACIATPAPVSGDGSCVRCGVRACDGCGRDPATVACVLCRREVCVSWCLGDTDVCRTCETLDLAPGLSLDLPPELAATGCTVRGATDDDATVVQITGQGRREAVVLRDGRVGGWFGFADPEVGCRQIWLARRAGGHCQVQSLETCDEPDGDLTIVDTHVIILELPDGLSLTARSDGESILPTLDVLVADEGPLPGWVPAPDAVPWPDPPSEGHMPLAVARGLMLRHVDVGGVLIGDPRGVHVETYPWARTPAARDRQRRYSVDVEGSTVVWEHTGSNETLLVETPGGPAKSFTVTSVPEDRLSRKIGEHLDVDSELVQVAVVADSTYTIAPKGPSCQREVRPLTLPAETEQTLGVEEAARRLGLTLPPEEDDLEELPDGVETSLAGVPEPTWARVAVGFDVDERITTEAGEERLSYMITPTSEGTVAVLDGTVVGPVEADREGHLGFDHLECLYCRESVCSRCVDGVEPCGICAFLICRRCGRRDSALPAQVCEACTHLKRVPAGPAMRASRGDAATVLMAEDQHHSVAIGRLRQGFGVVSLSPSGDVLAQHRLPEDDRAAVYLFETMAGDGTDP